MIDGEQLVTFEAAGRLFPRPVHKTTVWRWARDGVRGVKLETARYGRSVYTSVEALGRFGRTLAELDTVRITTSDQGNSRPSPVVRRRKARGERREESLHAAEEYLAELGI